MRSYASDAGGEGVKRYDTNSKRNRFRCILCVLITVFGLECFQFLFHFVADVRITENVVVVMVVSLSSYNKMYVLCMPLLG